VTVGVLRGERKSDGPWVKLSLEVIVANGDDSSPFVLPSAAFGVVEGEKVVGQGSESSQALESAGK